VTILDKREIEFDSDALVYCLSMSPRAAQGFGLPAMAPSEVRFNPKDGMVDVVYGKKEGLGAVRISVEALGAVMISYCIRAKIPMPRVADKSIRMESHSIILAFKTRFTKAPAPEQADSSSRAAEAVKSWKWIDPARPGPGNA
jgi:hypothetical protein